MTEGLRIREDEPPSPEAAVADGAVRRLVLVRREITGSGDSQEPSAPGQLGPFKRYALATQQALQAIETPGDTAA